MVATGYKEQGSTKRVLYWDPLPVNRGNQTEMSYEAYGTTVRANGATYYNFARRAVPVQAAAPA